LDVFKSVGYSAAGEYSGAGRENLIGPVKNAGTVDVNALIINLQNRNTIKYQSMKSSEPIQNRSRSGRQIIRLRFYLYRQIST